MHRKLIAPVFIFSLACGGEEPGTPAPQTSKGGPASASSSGAKTPASKTPSQTDPNRPSALTAEHPAGDAATEEEPEAAAEPVTTGDTECSTSLTRIQELQNGQVDAGMGEPLPTKGWAPSSAPGATPRDWTDGNIFDTLGWKPDGQVHGSYKITTSGSNYTVTCITDLDGDGAKATWTVGKSGTPTRTTAEGVR